MLNIIQSIIVAITLLAASPFTPTAAAKPALLNHVVAKQSKDFTGTVVKVLDGDTYLVQRDNDKGGPVKVRLHWADCPEIAHNANEVDQPGGKEAAADANKLLQNQTVTVHQCGLSYGRIVGDVVCGKIDAAIELVKSGNAQLDPRYRPTKALTDAEADAKKNKRGLWSQTDPTPIAPWDWRKLTRDQQIKARSK